MIIDKLKKEDLKIIEELEKENFDDPWSLEFIENDLNNDELADFMVMKDGETIVGYYDVWYMFENADIANICVRKEYQGKGLGEYLLKDLIKRCVRKNVEFLHLEVRVDNIKARKLYEKLGFIETRVRKGYYNGVDGIDMVKGLLGLSEKDFSD